MRWMEQRWPDVQAWDKDAVVVLPLGSIEQHGLHLPLLTDTLLVSTVAERAAERLDADRYLWLPTLWLGCSEHHRAMPGTLSLPAAVYTEVLERLLEGLIADGFRRIVLLNGHGGNISPGTQALYNVSQRHQRPELWVVLASYWKVAGAALTAVEGMVTEQLTHACEYETSMVLALRPELVKLEAARGSSRPFDSEWFTVEGPSPVIATRGFHQLTENGAMGRPELASADKGERLLEAVVDRVATFLIEFAQWPPLG